MCIEGVLYIPTFFLIIESYVDISEIEHTILSSSNVTVVSFEAMCTYIVIIIVQLA